MRSKCLLACFCKENENEKENDMEFLIKHITCCLGEIVASTTNLLWTIFQLYINIPEYIILRRNSANLNIISNTDFGVKR